MHQAAWPPFKKRQELVTPKLPTHYWSTADINGTNLEDMLGQIDADDTHFGHGWLLRFGTMTSYYGATRRREQEPSTPSIEQVFVKLKCLLLSAAVCTKESLWTTIGQPLDQFKPADRCNCLTNSGCEFM